MKLTYNGKEVEPKYHDEHYSVIYDDGQEMMVHNSLIKADYTEHNDRAIGCLTRLFFLALTILGIYLMMRGTKL